MRTKPELRSTDPLARLREALTPPYTWHITGISAFWLEDGRGLRRTGEFEDTGPAYDAVLDALANGVSADDIVLAGLNRRGERQELGRGLELQDIAEAHAGLPARRREVRRK